MSSTNQKPVKVLKVNLYGSTKYYFEDMRDLHAFRELRKNAVPDPPKTMTRPQFHALKRLGINFDVTKVRRKRNRHSELTSQYEKQLETGDWKEIKNPPWEDPTYG